MGNFGAELRQVLRRLGRAKLFTAVVILTLAAGVGANAIIFGVLESVLLKPLPYHKPGELAGVWLTAPGLNLPQLNLRHPLISFCASRATALRTSGCTTEMAPALQETAIRNNWLAWR